MKKIFFLVSLIGITLIFFIGNNRNFEIGTIKNIKITETKTTFYLENKTEELIAFEKITGIKNKDKIKFIGNLDFYMGKKQIILEKIYLIKE